MENYITNLRNTGNSARTANAALTAMKGFSGWLIKEQRLTTDPLKRISKINQQTDKRLIRRSLTEAEITLLLNATVISEKHHSLTGYERSLIYRIALSTGLRYSEIRLLNRNDFTLNDITPFIIIQAANAKNKKKSTLPLQPQLASDINDYFQSKLALPASPAFVGMNIGRGAEMIKQDFDTAGINWRKNDNNEILDFHSLRHTFGTMLAKTGTHPKTAQEMMRHSDINLTMGLYTHTLLVDKAEATAKLPEFIPEIHKIISTGTDNQPIFTDNNNTANITQREGKNKGNYKGANVQKKEQIGNICRPNEVEETGLKKTVTPISNKDYSLSETWHSHGDSNPSLQTENLSSWTRLDDGNISIKFNNAIILKLTLMSTILI